VKGARILRWSLLGIAGIAVLACLALLISRMRTQSSPDAVARLEQVYAGRTPVADANNGFLDVLGFSAPAGTDPNELGARRIAWLRKKRTDPANAGVAPDVERIELGAHRSPELVRVVFACKTDAARACVDALARVTRASALNDLEPSLLERYDVLLGRSGWFESVADMGGTVPPFQNVIEAQRLLLIRLRDAAASRDTARIRATLGRDLAFWRGVLESSDILISKMIAVAAIRQHFTLGSYVLRDLPAGDVVEAIPAEWRTELSAPERSMLRVMAGEIVYAEGLLARGYETESNVRRLDTDQPATLLDRLFRRSRIAASPRQELSDFADACLAVGEGFQVPLNQYVDVGAKIRARFSDRKTFGNFEQYALRVAGVEGMRRAALLTAQLRGRAVAASEVAASLRESSLRNPFDNEPFTWNSNQREVVYVGPERHKSKSFAILY
jgi:hypothetical protein